MQIKFNSAGGGKQKKQLDILINNAGITGFQEGFGLQDPENASLDSWRKVHAVNSDGVFLGCQKAIQHMKQKKGSIVNISSRSGMVGIPGAAAYAASKAAVRNHTKSVALYCCEKGYDIRCNSIHPAAILIPQEAADLVCSVALGGVSKKPDVGLHELLNRAPLILLSLDFDDPGKKRYSFRMRQYPNLRPLPSPFCKSVGDAYQNKRINVRFWLSLE